MAIAKKINSYPSKTRRGETTFVYELIGLTPEEKEAYKKAKGNFYQESANGNPLAWTGNFYGQSCKFNMTVNGKFVFDDSAMREAKSLATNYGEVGIRVALQNPSLMAGMFGASASAPVAVKAEAETVEDEDPSKL